MEGCQETELVACAKARVSFKFAGGAFDSAQVERGAREGECNSLILSCAACSSMTICYLVVRALFETLVWRFRPSENKFNAKADTRFMIVNRRKPFRLKTTTFLWKLWPQHFIVKSQYNVFLWSNSFSSSYTLLRCPQAAVQVADRAKIKPTRPSLDQAQRTLSSRPRRE